MNHYTAGVILHEDSKSVRRQSLSKVQFDNYNAIVSFVNTKIMHWKLLYINPTESSVYLVDPFQTSAEQAESEMAANKFCEYFQTRTIHHRKRDWVDIKFKGAVMQHPVQQDGSSCGVIVMMMARAVIETFPKLPNMTFGTTKEEMVQERRALAVKVLEASVFDAENSCSMCSATRPPLPRLSVTDWIQCDSCSRWFHAQCVEMDSTQLKQAKNAAWDCCLCKA
ncbi:hypothetical protein IRJ41_005503 [Triplophysa rosa]|uniref:PHD-type domain-containing protein n=1 Tax=Triplophysa rosa TaxID=992332 RepID=A0A9W7T5G9_TRIRA|nr:hypothetical protein IRJ41_005503 [Triplophysa rosa]